MASKKDIENIVDLRRDADRLNALVALRQPLSDEINQLQLENGRLWGASGKPTDDALARIETNQSRISELTAELEKLRLDAPLSAKEVITRKLAYPGYLAGVGVVSIAFYALVALALYFIVVWAI